MKPSVRAFSALLGMTLALSPFAYAGDYDAVVGIWQMTVKMGAQNNESTLTLSEEDGVLKGLAGSERGSLPVQDLVFNENTLSWSVTLRDQKMPIEVTVDGDTFEGVLKSPIGSLPVSGKRVTEEDLAAQKNAMEALIGDWEVYSEYDGNTIESKIRIYIDEGDGDFEAMIIGPGSRVMARRLELAGDTLRMVVGFPFISDRPAVLEAKLTDNKFEGVVSSVLGDIPVRGELVDVAKLVVAPYDSPEPILGGWDFVAHLDNEEHAGTITFFEDGPVLKAQIETETGLSLESESVEYKQVGDTMGVIRLHVVIPDLGAENQVIELIVNGERFDGEELHSGGTFYLEGTKQT